MTAPVPNHAITACVDPCILDPATR